MSDRSFVRSVLIPLGLALGLSVALAPGSAHGYEWPSWRGPHQNGVSHETGLIDTWSQDGENLLWRQDFTGRSTPAVFNGRACANGRSGEGESKQEVIACWDAESGKQLWERRYNVYHTTVPFNRVGWGNVTGDPETGYLYAQNVDGQLVALDSATGETVWEWRLAEDVGRVEGYGGRTHTPIVDQDRVVITVVSSSWGENGRMQHRYFAFDKRTGAVQWVTTLGPDIFDKNTYSMPSVAVIDGERLIVGGTAGGWIHAVQARTGKPVWGFKLSLRGVNSSVLVDGDTVYAGHSHENIDEPVMGRLVAIDATGEGDVTGSKERWRLGKGIGHATPLLYNGRLYAVDNSANLYAINPADGTVLWEHNFGTVGKTSPVFADGKIYLPELNGNLYIYKLTDTGLEELDHEHIEMPDGRYAEIYGSVAVAYGRIYFITEEGVYCLGKKDRPFQVEPNPPVSQGDEGAPAADAKAAWLQVLPAEAVGYNGAAMKFTAKLYDDKGRFLKEAQPTWSVDGLQGKVDPQGTFLAPAGAPSQAGHVKAKVGDLEGGSRVRLAGSLPWTLDFEDEDVPGHWIGAARKADVGFLLALETAQGKVLIKPKSKKGVPRATFFMGPEDMSGYTIQADVYAAQEGRRKPDVGVVNSGYTFDLQGNHQRLSLYSWPSELRMAKTIDYPWEMGTWYTMKLRVDQDGGKAHLHGKVWKRGEPEPEGWTLETTDDLPITQGSPGLYGFTYSPAYYDNVKVTESGAKTDGMAKP